MDFLCKKQRSFIILSYLIAILSHEERTIGSICVDEDGALTCRYSPNSFFNIQLPLKLLEGAPLFSMAKLNVPTTLLQTWFVLFAFDHSPDKW
jgi:hypothetical protein